MIKYGNTELTDIAPVKIDDIEVSPISFEPVTRQRAIRFGADFVRMGGGTRTVTVTFALLTTEDREEYLQAIRDWAVTDREQTLALPLYENRHLECVCTQHPDASFRRWWEGKLRLVFTCYNNPYWTSDQLIEVPCGTQFSIGGSAPPQMTIERNGVTPIQNAKYISADATMEFTTLPAGNVVIDLNRQTAAIGDTSIMRYYKPNSTWIVPKIGAMQTITGNGTIKYRERWV